MHQRWDRWTFQMFAKKFLWEGMHDILYRLHMLTDVACLSPCRRITVTSYFLQRAGGSDKRQKSAFMCAWQVCAVVQSLEVTAQMIETCHSFMLEPYWSIYLHQSEPRRWAIYCLRYRNSGCPNCRQSAPWQMDRVDPQQVGIRFGSEIGREICYAAMSCT